MKHEYKRRCGNDRAGAWLFCVVVVVVVVVKNFFAEEACQYLPGTIRALHPPIDRDTMSLSLKPE